MIGSTKKQRRLRSDTASAVLIDDIAGRTFSVLLLYSKCIYFPSNPPTYSAMASIFSSVYLLPTIWTLTCAPSYISAS